MKPRLLLACLCDLCHYSWKAAHANRFPKILFIKKQTQWSNDKTILLLNSVVAKYRDLSVSRRSIIICLSLRLWQITHLLATDKSRYFAQPCPIIANYWQLGKISLDKKSLEIQAKSRDFILNPVSLIFLMIVSLPNITLLSTLFLLYAYNKASLCFFTAI